jgi:DNA-binding GntR family transcriptional regulator
MAARRVPIKSVVDHVYEQLRDEIVRVQLPAGTSLPLGELAEQFGVSTMPIRAALLRLEGEGFVDQLRHRGAIVAPLSLEDLDEIQAVRAGIEGFAARLGAERIGVEDLRRMSSLLERVRGRRPRTSLDSYISFQWSFDGICYAAAGRKRLIQLIADYQRRAERYIRLAIGSGTGFEESIRYQERFLDACRKRNGDEAEQVIREALAWTVERIAPLVREEQQQARRRSA